MLESQVGPAPARHILPRHSPLVVILAKRHNLDCFLGQLVLRLELAATLVEDSLGLRLGNLVEVLASIRDLVLEHSRELVPALVVNTVQGIPLATVADNFQEEVDIVQVAA